MREKEIQRILHRRYDLGASVACLPNTYMVMDKFEADMLVLMKSGYVIEFEIKSTRADFLSEFRNKPDKHEILAGGELLFKHATRGQVEYKPTHLPNRYVFVTPKGMVDSSEIPDYAGLLEFDYNFPREVMVKKAPLLHTNKASAELLTKLLSSAGRKIWGGKC